MAKPDPHTFPPGCDVPLGTIPNFPEFIFRVEHADLVFLNMTFHSNFRRSLLPPPGLYYRREGLKLIGRGEWRSTLCTFHRDRNPSLSVHMLTGGFICHACYAKGGNVLDFHMLRHNLDFVAAAKELGAWETSPHRQSTPAPARRPHDPVKTAARQFAERDLGNHFTPEALHAYRDEYGSPAYWVIRARDTVTGKKWIRPMHFDGNRFVLGKPRFREGTPLYNLNLIATRKDEIVIVSEGEKCADELCKVGLLATTSGSATSADKANWQPLIARDVLIWPDYDEPGQNYAQAVATRLNGVASRTRIIDSSTLNLELGGDAVDWLAANPGASGDTILNLPLVDATPAAGRLGNTVHPSYGEPPSPIVERVTEWITLHCTRHPRVSGGLYALYRDFAAWVEPYFAFSPGEFVVGLEQLGLVMQSGLVVGLALTDD